MQNWIGRAAPGLVVALCLAAPLAHAAEPTFGGWRNLDSRDGAEPALRDVPFAVLPTTVARDARFSIYDRESKRLVCCLQVASAELDDTALRKTYQLPEPWVSDLRNGRSTARPWPTRVYQMRRTDELVGYGFSDAPEAYSDLGGLLLPADARLLPDGSVQAGATYRLQFRSTPLGDDSSALDRFTLQPLQGEGKPVVVEVSYGTY
ncbi:TPA: decarboxylase [Stenotrophomonas maltophilia]|uniref:decarboxylase n=1 Tax=Stenotrophomonas maltophilia TaxID=40324 RepID=UPI0015DF869D|nr:decarboxylase [Stenotrophomonas maltophilia]MBA0448285.1 decarboxylase [Stenotrophomonas maltophilia]HEL2977779.1 decarboxylase [Stenotrophomonas maltophilia]